MYAHNSFFFKPGIMRHHSFGRRSIDKAIMSMQQNTAVRRLGRSYGGEATTGHSHASAASARARF